MVSSLVTALILAISMVSHGQRIQDQCPKNLTWQRISYLDNSQSISIEACCNVSTVTVVQVLKDWRLNEPPIIDRQPIDDLVIPGFEMQISVCADGTVAAGNVLRGDCRLEIGKVLQLGYEHIERFDQWYITCFTVSNLRRGCQSKFCSLDRFCTSTARCDKVWLSREIVNTTQTNMTILIKVGNILEGTDLYIEVDEMSPSAYLGSTSYTYQQRQTPSKQSNDLERENTKKFYRTSASAPIGQNLIYDVQNLNPDKYYVVRTCAKLRTPSSFFQQHRDFPIPAESVYCLEDASYWPGRYRYSSNGSAYMAPHGSLINVIAFLCWVLVMVL